MGGAVKSLGGFLGFDTGDKAPQGQFHNAGLQNLGEANRLYGNSDLGAKMQGLLSQYAQGDMSSGDFLGQSDKLTGPQAARMQSMRDALATDSMTGSKFATEQVMNSPLLGQLFGKDGALSRSVGKEQELQNRGFSLQPEDKEAYGQISGDIARMFGQTENSMAQSLANRGLAAAPSGAAGAMFSGAAGNKNEQLAKAQMGIAQKRMQDTMQRIQQQQQFISQLGNQAAGAVQDQFGRQTAGASNMRDSLSKQAQMQAAQNNAQNEYAMKSAEYNSANTPLNFMDYATTGVGQGIQGGLKSSTSSMFGGGGGMPGNAPPPGMTGPPQKNGMF